MNPMQLMKIKGAWDKFQSNHPKFPKFMNAVAQEGVTEGTIIEINIKKPDGKEYASNLKLQQSDLELFNSLKN